MSVLEQTNQDLADVKDLLENKEKLNNIKINATINTPSLTSTTATFQKKYFDNVLDKISIQNYTLLKTESLQQDFYKQLNKFVKDSKFVISEIEKLDNVITELGNVGGFSDTYLKDFNKGTSDNYFDFIESYITPINEDNNSFLNNDFSILEVRRRYLPEFDKNIISKNYVSDITKLFQEKYDYISSASFASQNLINLYRNYNYFYPNCISIKINSENVIIDTVLIENIFDKTRTTYLTVFDQNIIQSYQSSSLSSRLTVLNLHNQINNTFYSGEFFNKKNKDYFLIKVDGLDDQITNKENIILDSNKFSSIKLGTHENIDFDNYISSNALKNKICNYNIIDCSLIDNDITFYGLNDFLPAFYSYKPAIRIKSNKIRGQSDYSFTNNTDDFTLIDDEASSNFTRDGFYNNKSAISKTNEFDQFIINDGIYSNIDDSFLSDYYFKNNAKIFEDSLDYFSLIDNKNYKFFEFPLSYNIKSRYLYYKEQYNSLFPHLGPDDLCHLSIKSSSNGAKLLVKPVTYNDINKITLITKKEDSFLNNKSYNYKIAINKCINEYLDLKLKNNIFYSNIKENFNYIEYFYLNKQDSNSLCFLNNQDKGLIKKDTNGFLLTKIEEENYLNIDNSSKIIGLKNSINKISKESVKFKVEKKDIDDFKKNVLNNSIFKNRTSLNKRVFKDVGNLFLEFGKEFKKDYQTSAFDKLLTSLFCNDKTLNSSENISVLKLLIACAILKRNNVELNYMSGTNNKIDVDYLEKIIEFKNITKHIFSSRNISYQENYILESNVLGHFLDKTEKNKSFLQDYKHFIVSPTTETSSDAVWNQTRHSPTGLGVFKSDTQLPNGDFINEGKNVLSLSKRICNSIALCFPYNTLNNFGTAKTLDHKRNIPVYYEYGNSINSSFNKTKNALHGNAYDKIITFSAPEYGDIVLNTLNLPQPIVHRKINTIDSYKNTLSSIENSKFYEDECFTVAMHYLWDKTFDYKDIELLDGTKINDIDDFIKYFSKKDQLPKFSNTWENLKDTSSYPLHEMFYINRVLKNKFFDNLKNENSIVNKLSYFVIDFLDSIKSYKEINNISTLEDSLKFVEENNELLNTVFNATYCYSIVYEEYYNNFIENYFSCIQEIPFVKDSIYDLGVSNELSDDNNSAVFYYSFTSDNARYLKKAKSSYIEISATGNFFRLPDVVEDLDDIYHKTVFEIGETGPNFYSSFAESLHDNTLSISYAHDKKYMFQENASLYFNRNNRISIDSEDKAFPYVNANDYLEKCLDIVEISMRENYIENIENFNINDELDNIDFNKNTTLSMFKDVHESLRKLDLNVGLSFDILIGYTRRLIEFNELITKYKRGIAKTENILNEVKSEFDDTEVAVLESMLNDVYRNKLKQNVCYLNDYIKNVEKSIYLKDKTVEDVTEQFDITHFEKIKYDNSIKYIKEYPKTSTNNDIIILKFNEELIKTITNSTLIKFLVTKTYFNSDEEEIYEFYYSPIITHFEFLKTKETYNSIGYIDLQEKSIENSYKILTREEFLENYKDILNIEDEVIANRLFNTYQDSNFCKAALNLCLGTNIKDGLHNTDDFISIDTVGLIENVEEFNLNKTFKVNSFPFEEIQEFSGEVYNNVSNKFDNSKNSFIRKHLSCISKFNSNIQIQQMLSNNNVDDYIAFNLVRPFSNIDSGLFNYTIQAEEIF